MSLNEKRVDLPNWEKMDMANKQKAKLSQYKAYRIWDVVSQKFKKLWMTEQDISKTDLLPVDLNRKSEMHEKMRKAHLN